MNEAEPPATVGVVIPAAGTGARMGGVRKPWLVLAGEPILAHALRPFLDEPRVVAVVVALAAADAADPPSWLVALDPRVSVVAGGTSRTESVRKGVAAVPADVGIIAVHDAARPLVTLDVVTACIDVASWGEGAVAGSRVVDTLKEVDARSRIVDTPDRGRFWHAQTPQAFPAGVLRRAYEGDVTATDDATLVERLGVTVRMIDAGPRNMKVTRPGDVAVAEAYLADVGAE